MILLSWLLKLPDWIKQFLWAFGLSLICAGFGFGLGFHSAEVKAAADARKAHDRAVTQATKAETQIIHQTRTITKVVHDVIPQIQQVPVPQCDIEPVLVPWRDGLDRLQREAGSGAADGQGAVSDPVSNKRKDGQ